MRQFDLPWARRNAGGMHVTRLCLPAVSTTASHWLVWTLVTLLALATVQPAAAAPTATAEQEKQALALATQARSHYRDKDFAGAADLFMKAYAQIPEPTLLFNAARAYENAGKLREAVPLFRLYLSVNRQDDDESRAGRKDAETHLADIERLLRAEETLPAPGSLRPVDAPAEPPPEPQPSRSQPAVAQPPEAGPPAGAAVYRPGLFERVQPRQAGWSAQRKTAVAAGALGAALLIAGSVVGIAAASDLDFVDENRLVGNGLTLHPTVTQREADAAFAAHASRKAWSGGLIGLGAAAVGAGVVLWLSEPARAAHVTTRLWPSIEIGSGMAACALAGRF